MRQFKAFFAVAASLALCGCSVFGVRTAEQAPYSVVITDDSFEVRQYPQLTVARTVVAEGDYERSSGAGFQRLAGYIFGGNRQRQDIAMTAPVLLEPASNGEQIAMTAPVLTETLEQGMQMTFVMPGSYTAGSLPLPEDERVEIAVVPPRTVAALRFSGRLDAGDAARADALRDWLAERGYRAISAPRLAGFDPPWALPFLRRNEVQIDVAPQG